MSAGESVPLLTVPPAEDRLVAAGSPLFAVVVEDLDIDLIEPARLRVEGGDDSPGFVVNLLLDENGARWCDCWFRSSSSAAEPLDLVVLARANDPFQSARDGVDVGRRDVSDGLEDSRAEELGVLFGEGRSKDQLLDRHALRETSDLTRQSVEV